MTRRLMKYAGLDPATGKPVFLTTLCGAAGGRRLLRDTGEVYLGRRVFELAECTNDPCLIVPCCAATPLPRTLYLTLSAPGTCLDGQTVPLVISSVFGDWEGTLIVDCGGGENVVIEFRLACGSIWQLEYFNGGTCALAPFHIAPGNGGLISFFLPFVRNTVVCDPFLLTAEDEATTGTALTMGRLSGPLCAGEGTHVVITIAASPPGSGSGSGGGANPCLGVGVRGLMKFAGLDPATGKPVFLTACCPPGSGSGSGGGVATDCCPAVRLSTSLLVTFTQTAGAACALDGQTVGVTFIGFQTWRGTVGAAGHTWTVDVICSGGSFSVNVTGDTGPCSLNFTMTLDSCDPLHLTGTGQTTGAGCTGCASATFSVVVTRP